jgi:hypothetical protein
MSTKGDHLDRALEKLRSARAESLEGAESHRATRDHVQRVGELVENARAALKAGNTAAIRARLQDIENAASDAIHHHSLAGGSFSRCRRSIERAVEHLGRAQDAEESPQIDPMANPSGAIGAQVSDGQKPRARDDYERRRVELAGLRRQWVLWGGR